MASQIKCMVFGRQSGIKESSVPVSSALSIFRMFDGSRKAVGVSNLVDSEKLAYLALTTYSPKSALRK